MYYIYYWFVSELSSLSPKHSKKCPIIASYVPRLFIEQNKQSGYVARCVITGDTCNWDEPHTSELNDGSNIHLYSRKSLIWTSIILTRLSRPCPPLLATFGISKLAGWYRVFQCPDVQFQTHYASHIGDSSKSEVSANATARVCRFRSHGLAI